MNVRSIIYGAIKDVEKQLRHDDIAYKVVVRENSVDLLKKKKLHQYSDNERVVDVYFSC